MMKRTHLNLLLLLVAIGLGVAVFFGQKKEEKGPPLTALAPAAIERITIEHPGAAAIRLEKRDAEWKLVAPVAADTDTFEVASLVGLADTEVKSTLPEGVDVKPLGLDPPGYTVTLNDQAIAVGGSEPLKYRRYVRVGSGPVRLIDDPPETPLDADYSDLVSKSLLPPKADITRISLPGLDVAKDNAGAWRAAGQADATPAQLEALVAAWRDAKAMWNAAELPNEPAKGDPVAITLANGQTLGFIVAAREPQLILVRPDLKVRYTVSKESVETLLQLKKTETPTTESK